MRVEKNDSIFLLIFLYAEHEVRIFSIVDGQFTIRLVVKDFNQQSRILQPCNVTFDLSDPGIEFCI